MDDDLGIMVEFEFLPASDKGGGFISGAGAWMRAVPRLGDTIQTANGYKWRVKDVIWRPWGQGQNVHPAVKVVLDKRTRVTNE